MHLSVLIQQCVLCENGGRIFSYSHGLRMGLNYSRKRMGRLNSDVCEGSGEVWLRIPLKGKAVSGSVETALMGAAVSMGRVQCVHALHTNRIPAQPATVSY